MNPQGLSRVRRCCHCERRGATLGCRVERCPNSFHLACAGAAGCTFYPAKFLVACQQHAPMFQAEPGAERWDGNPCSQSSSCWSIRQQQRMVCARAESRLGTSISASCSDEFLLMRRPMTDHAHCCKTACTAKFFQLHLEASFEASVKQPSLTTADSRPQVIITALTAP